MCGICGIAGARRSLGEIEHKILLMRESMLARGPDDAGIHVDERIALGVRRLAVLDLSPLGHMPMWSASGRYCIVHNGEIFNFRELRAGLERRGVQFKSQSDTEVIVELFERDGAAMLPRLNGMFAFAIWDDEQRSLFIARDRMGVKPLYYAWHEGALLFASEQKALFAGGAPKRFVESTWEELLCFRYTAGERTPLLGVKRLLPGHWLRWRADETCVERWWSLPAGAQERRGESTADEQWFPGVFYDAVALRRISDVPVGVLLSGGLDSSAVAATLAMQTRTQASTFTVRFEEEGYDESVLAREMADHAGLTYHDLTVPSSQLFAHLRTASAMRDEPLAHANELHLWLVSVMAKPLVTVLLSGEGADEVLGGYVRYQPLRFLPELFAVSGVIERLSAYPFGHRMRKMARFLGLGGADDYVLFNACDVLPTELRTLGLEPGDRFDWRRNVLEEARAVYPDEPVRQAMYLDQHTFLCSLLDRNDRMTMGASVECRVPFLDVRLVEGIAAAPSETLFRRFRGKEVLRRAVGDIIPRSVLAHRKWGFGVPWGKHLRENSELRQFVGMLPALEPIKSGPFARKRVRALVDAFLRGDTRRDELVFQLAMVAVWHDSYIQA